VRLKFFVHCPLPGVRRQAASTRKPTSKFPVAEQRLDGADIVFQRSTGKGLTFSAPLELNAAPGEDRPQWFPWVTVDSTSGRVHVFY
jgi:hypothetical protein